MTHVNVNLMFYAMKSNENELTWVAKNSFPTILSSLPDFSHFLNPENCSSIFNPEHHVRQNKEKKIN